MKAPAPQQPVELPAVESLSGQQQRGVHCVFCAATLRTGALRDLGAQVIEVHGSTVRWFPRCCRTCPKGMP